ncbi:MAG: diphosphomevalonate decarboxylase [Flavobacteriales bacterium]|nr:diphosphomevalonate decarboxylase [Flavobacteriales bacterium]MCX7651095.1 diphosphomevalonate decarboxylase [Flavobacteriales bacterium]MDW8431383.1 diphosphomevalonate decarboxylase [Flavobacteriales bacterium]
MTQSEWPSASLARFPDPSQILVRTAWKSPSNIALVKYWGKFEGQLPANPSLSITLSACYTETEVVCTESESGAMEVSFLLDGQPKPAFEDKLKTFCQSLLPQKPFLKGKHLWVRSRNTFPHSAGIASSASGMSAFCLALCTLENECTGALAKKEDFFSEASRLSRLASGSASRSVYGGFVLWGKHPLEEKSSDEEAFPVSWNIHPEFRGLNDWIVVCDRQEKAVSSRAGHGLMNGHPYAAERFRQAFQNIERMKMALVSGDWETFSFITEHEALSLHAMMMTSRPWFILMKPTTLALLDALKAFRANTGCRVTFTLDAGPNLHLLFPDSEKENVNDFLISKSGLNLRPEDIIQDKEGTGPERIL